MRVVRDRGDARRSVRALPFRGRGRLRRRRGVRGATARGRASRRSPTARRRRGRDGPRRSRLLPTAPLSEDARDRARTRARVSATVSSRPPMRLGTAARVARTRDGRVSRHPRFRVSVRVHRDERARPGRAHDHGGRDGSRSRRACSCVIAAGETLSALGFGATATAAGSRERRASASDGGAHERDGRRAAGDGNARSASRFLADPAFASTRICAPGDAVDAAYDSLLAKVVVLAPQGDAAVGAREARACAGARPRSRASRRTSRSCANSRAGRSSPTAR